MKILVTGATSGLGLSLVKYLQQKKYTLVATGRNALVGEKLTSLGIPFFAGDLSLSCQSPLLEKTTTVVHCAALSSPWGRYRDFYQANVLATQNVIDACFKYRIDRLIHISTPSVYFNFKDRTNIQEQEAIAEKPANYYVKTKLLAEELVFKAKEAGLQIICLRPRGIIGPDDQAIIPRFLKLCQKGKIPLINHGSAIADFSCVDNVIHAIQLAMHTKSNDAIGKIYNISNGSPITIKRFIELLTSALQINCEIRNVNFYTAYWFAFFAELICQLPFIQLEPMITRYTAGIMAKSQSLDITQAKVLLGYQPSLSLEDGIKSYSAAWKKYVNC